MYFFYFYPLGLDRRTLRRPVLSAAIAAVIAVAFVWMRYLPGLLPLDPWDLVFFPGHGWPWTVVTAVFMHAGWMHVLGNLVYWWVFAPPLESRLGRARFLLYVLIFGVAGNVVHGLISVLGLLGQGGWGVLGTSGAIAGLLGFSLVRLYDAKVTIAWWVLAPLAGQNRAGRTPIPLAGAVVMWGLWQVIQAALAPETGSSVSFGAHLGGLAMGVALALMMGEHRHGRLEARLARGRRYFREGAFHAAVGEFSDYAEAVPGDPEGQVELARARQLIGRTAEAAAAYRRAFELRLGEGRIGEMLEIAAEWIRQQGPEAPGPEVLAKVAYYHEKQLEYDRALEIYSHLGRIHPTHPQGQRALVRGVVLCRGKAADPERAEDWLRQAHATLPAGSWRDFLEREFNLPAGPRAGGQADPAPAFP